MGIRVYCGTDFEQHEHEWKQFLELVNVAKIEYEDKNDFLIIVGNVYVGGRKLDAIIIKKRGIAIVDFKSYEGEVHGSENGEWYVINNQGEREKLHQNLFEQLDNYKYLLSNKLKSIRPKFFPYIKKKQLNFMRCWGYFESGTFFDNKQIDRKNRITFDVINRESLIEKLRFLNCGFELTTKSIDDLLKELNVKICEGLSEDGENTTLAKIEERFHIDVDEILENLVIWGKKKLNSEDLKIKSFTTRQEVDYYPLEAFSSENISLQYYRPSHHNKKEVIELLEREEKDYHLLLGIPGSGKTSSLKKLFQKTLNNFMSDVESKFPILIRLSEFEVGMIFEDYIAKYFLEIYKEIQHFIDKGKTLIILDAWDELNPSNRIEIESFSKNILKKGNRLIISSRLIYEDDYPKIQKDSRELYKSDNLSILPIDIQKIDKYFLSRNKKLANDYIQQLKELIKRSKIETIPLWMDLIVDFYSVYNDRKVDEIMLLAHWVESAALQNKNIDKIRDLIEKIAFLSFFDDSYQITGQSTRDIIDSQSFEELKRLGWIVPAGFFKGENKFEFVHKRLQEYLCASHVRSNWHNLTDDLFDRQNGLLSRRKSDDIFDLVLLESVRLGLKTTVIVEMIYQIAGEDNWFLDGKLNLNLLRDPIIAAILAKRLKLDDAFYSDELKTIVEQVWFQYNNQGISQTTRNLLTWVDQRKVEKAIYLMNLPLAMKTIPSSTWLGDLEQHNIFNDTIELLMDELSKSLMINMDFTDKFFYILRYDYSDRLRWKTTIIDLINHIQKKPYLIKDENRIEIDPLSGKFDWRLITKNAFYTLLEIDEDSANETIRKWVYTDDKELELFAVLEFTAATLGKLPEIDKFFQKWLLNKEESIRFKIINKLFWTSDFCNLKPENILSTMNSDLTNHDFETWFENVELTDFKNKENESVLMEWLNSDRDPLFLWLCSNHSFYDLIWKLPVYNCNGLLTKIITLHEGPRDDKEVIGVLNYISDQFPFKKEVELLEEYVFSKKFSGDLEDFLDKRKILKLLNSEDGIDLAIQLLHHEDEDIRYESMYKCICANSDQIIDQVRQILLSKKPEDERNTNDLWKIILGSSFDIIERYLETGLLQVKNNVQEHLLSKLYYEGENYKYGEKIISLIMQLLENENRDVKISASELISFFPSLEKKEGIKKLIASSDEDLNAVALRIHSVSVGLNLHRIIIKTLTTINYKIIRPSISGNQIFINDSYGGYGAGFQFLCRDERLEETRQKTENINFGLRGLHVTEYIKKHFNEKTTTELYVQTVPYFFCEREINKIIKHYINPTINLCELTEEDLVLYHNILKEEKYNHLHLTALFHLEEILLLKPDFFKFFEQNLLDIINTSEDANVLGIVQYLLFRYSDKNKIYDLYIQINDKYELNRQSLWWGIGLRDERDLQQIFIDDINNWENDEIFTILSLTLPFSNYSSSTFVELIKKLINQEVSSFFNNVTRYSFGSSIDNRLLFLDWGLITSLDCGKNSFLPSYGYDYVKAIDVLNNSLRFELNIPDDELSDLLNLFENHPSLYFKELADEIYLELGTKQISTFESLLKPDSDIYIFLFLLRHFELLSKDCKIQLVENFLINTTEIDELHILDNRSKDDILERIKINSETRKVFLTKLKEVKDMKILPLLYKIFEKNKEKEPHPFIVYNREIDIAQEIWTKHSIFFIEEDIGAVFDWLISLYNLDSYIKPSLYGLPRDLLFQLVELINEKNGEHTKLLNTLFFSLHDKLYYTYEDFWSHLLNKN